MSRKRNENPQRPEPEEPRRKDRLMTINDTDPNTYLVGLPPPRALILAFNLFRWWSGGLQGTYHLTGELTPNVGAAIERAEKRLGPGVLSVVQTDLAPYPPTDRMGDLMWMLNVNSIPFRQGRWLVVCSTADAPLPGHVVVFWDSHGLPVAERGDELRCTCGLPVTITATDVLCASGQSIWAAT